MKRGAFTLVELSIVLVILGLLIGGVLTGQSLIRAAELRSVSTQEGRYVTAVQTFRDKYFALPGDMTNAQSYWGIATNCPGTSSQPSTTAATCNGNGNGALDVNATSNERFRFWQHLANAGLIEGSYSGVDAGTNGQTTTTANAPTGRISSTLWYTSSWGALTGQGISFDGQYDNAIMFGGLQVNSFPAIPALKPEEAYNIDAKIDDGRPAIGKVVQQATMTGTSTSCTDASSSANLAANYLLNNTAISCALMFRQAF